VRAQLSSLYFRYLGTLENLTLTKVYPTLRTSLDVYADQSGAVYSATYRSQYAGFNEQVVEFETLFEDESFLTTTNARNAGLMQLPSSVERTVLSDVCEPGMLLNAHSRRLAQLCSTNRKRPRPIESLDEVIRAEKLFLEVMSRHRRELGYVTFDEVRAMAHLIKGRQFLPGSLRFLHWLLRRRIQKHKRDVIVV
jgi:hypothetical protein